MLSVVVVFTRKVKSIHWSVMLSLYGLGSSSIYALCTLIKSLRQEEPLEKSVFTYDWPQWQSLLALGVGNMLQ